MNSLRDHASLLVRSRRDAFTTAVLFVVAIALIVVGAIAFLRWAFSAPPAPADRFTAPPFHMNVAERGE
jgi:heme/copper-type cytochrome/quinol oxidase subunit 2